MRDQGANWRPAEEIVSVNKNLVQLELEFLGVLRRARPLGEWISSPLLRELWDWIDQDPRQAFLMTRIKTSHAMTPRHGVNLMLAARAWAVASHKLGGKLDDFSLAALLHDLGHWRPETLVFSFDHFTRSEWTQVQRHTQPDCDDFEALSADTRLWIAEHHEQPDGKGYPSGTRTPHLLSQMLRILDCFEGLTTTRRTRRAYSHADALRLMSRWSGYKFSAGLFKNFAKFVGHYPVGSFFRHRDGSVLVSLGDLPDGFHFLRVCDCYGDPVEDPELLVLTAHDVTTQHDAWREPDLPEAWLNLRPDLLGLPRSH